jgi:ligand-binding sensor domain-containing protein
LSDNWIQAMLEDSSGTLWIGTRDGGLVPVKNADKRLGYIHLIQFD